MWSSNRGSRETRVPGFCCIEISHFTSIRSGYIVGNQYLHEHMKWIQVLPRARIHQDIGYHNAPSEIPSTTSAVSALKEMSCTDWKPRRISFNTNKARANISQGVSHFQTEDCWSVQQWAESVEAHPYLDSWPIDRKFSSMWCTFTGLDSSPQFVAGRVCRRVQTHFMVC